MASGAVYVDQVFLDHNVTVSIFSKENVSTRSFMTVILAISICLYLVCNILFLLRWDKEPIRSRSPRFSFLMTFSAAIWGTVCLLRWQFDNFPCAMDNWLRNIGVASLGASSMVRIFILHFRYRLTRERMRMWRNSSLDSNEMKEKKKKNEGSATTDKPAGSSSRSDATASSNNHKSDNKKNNTLPSIKPLSKKKNDIEVDESDDGNNFFGKRESQKKKSGDHHHHHHDSKHHDHHKSSGHHHHHHHKSGGLQFTREVNIDFPMQSEVSQTKQFWFINHRWLMSTRILMYIYVAIVIISLFPAIVISFIHRGQIWISGPSACWDDIVGLMFSLLAGIYGIVFVIGSFLLLRKVREKLYIISEFQFLIIFFSIGILFTIILETVPAAHLYGLLEFPLNELNNIFFTWIITIFSAGYPVYLSYVINIKKGSLEDISMELINSDKNIQDIDFVHDPAGISYFVSNYTKNRNHLSLEFFVYFPEGLLAFNKFLTLEFSVENILFWQEVIAVEKLYWQSRLELCKRSNAHAILVQSAEMQEEETKKAHHPSTRLSIGNILRYQPVRYQPSLMNDSESRKSGSSTDMTDGRKSRDQQQNSSMQYLDFEERKSDHVHDNTDPNKNNINSTDHQSNGHVSVNGNVINNKSQSVTDFNMHTYPKNHLPEIKQQDIFKRVLESNEPIFIASDYLSREASVQIMIKIKVIYSKYLKYGSPFEINITKNIDTLRKLHSLFGAPNILDLFKSTIYNRAPFNGASSGKKNHHQLAAVAPMPVLLPDHLKIEKEKEKEKESEGGQNRSSNAHLSSRSISGSVTFCPKSLDPAKEQEEATLQLAKSLDLRLLTTLRKEIFDLMRVDSFSRFQKTNAYQEILQNMLATIEETRAVDEEEQLID